MLRVQMPLLYMLTIIRSWIDEVEVINNLKQCSDKKTERDKITGVFI